ncbi:MAG: exodeoxyribonuclease III [Hallerella succinigenes]|uniref:exodeoxyribonuclease III n=1 Tax=Hallerella succinigenes TaxID=1896222 RepID=UPI0023F4FDCC|nr:exodeoxyribonuclease III [Hallerella succinigenes]MDD6092748.1 exodeoxyribonuclease III [Hallerella succinigenes]MDY5028182.1 exodeoxyribonuclease III [Hallerella succinigenes]
MRLVSWNVAGIRACIKKGLPDFLAKIDADVFCMQEVKAEMNQIDFHPEGYKEYLYPAKRKGYSGTMIYSKTEPQSIQYGYGESEYDDEGRSITAEFKDFYLVTTYVPNVKRDLSRLESRMHFEDTFKAYLKKLEEKKPVILCGDLNVAHNEIDIYNARSNRGHAGFTDEERAKFTDLLASGFVDTFRKLHPDTVRYSWWSYIGHARDNNVGWRLDYFVVSESLFSKVKESYIYDDVFGSDHCPVGLEI